MKKSDVILSIFLIVALVGTVGFITFAWLGNQYYVWYEQEWHSPVLPKILEQASVKSGKVVEVVGMIKEEPVYSLDNREKVSYYSNFHKRFFVLEDGTVLAEWVGTLVHDTDQIVPSVEYIFKLKSGLHDLDSLERQVVFGEVPNGVQPNNFYNYICAWKEERE